MFFAESFLGGWHFLGPIAFAAARGAVASAPIARSDWPAVNLAKPFLGRTCSFPESSFCAHTLSITQRLFIFPFFRVNGSFFRNSTKCLARERQ